MHTSTGVSSLAGYNVIALRTGTGFAIHASLLEISAEQPSGFGPFGLSATTSRWFKPTNAEALALDFRTRQRLVPNLRLRVGELTRRVRGSTCVTRNLHDR